MVHCPLKTMQVMKKIYVGIDISKEKLNLCYLKDLAVIREEECEAGSSALGIQKFIAGWGGKILGSLLILVGLFMLFGGRLGLRGF